MDHQEIQSALNKKVTEDFEIIKNKIDTIEKTIQELDNAKRQDKNLTLELRYKKIKYEYFLSRNHKIYELIKEFKQKIPEISESIFIEQENTDARILLRDALYYRLQLNNNRHCDPESTHELNYIFGDLPAGRSIEFDSFIKNAYKTKDDNNHFYEFCEFYIDNFIINKISKSINDNFFLDQQSDLINECLHLYKEKSYIALSYIISPLIEGVLHDICQTMGLESIDYDRASLQESLKYIENEMPYKYGLEYLLFEFPIKRNRIAHGRIKSQNYRHLALHLLLDFNLAMNIALSKDVPLNKLLTIINNPQTTQIINIFNINHKILPEKIKDEYKKLGKFLIQDKFWHELENHCIRHSNDVVNIEKFTKNLIGRSNLFNDGVLVKQKSIEFIKNKLPNIKNTINARNEKTAELLKEIRILIGPST